MNENIPSFLPDDTKLRPEFSFPVQNAAGSDDWHPLWKSWNPELLPRQYFWSSIHKIPDLRIHETAEVPKSLIYRSAQNTFPVVHYASDQFYPVPLENNMFIHFIRHNKCIISDCQFTDCHQLIPAKNFSARVRWITESVKVCTLLLNSGIFISFLMQQPQSLEAFLRPCLSCPFSPLFHSISFSTILNRLNSGMEAL